MTKLELIKRLGKKFTGLTEAERHTLVDTVFAEISNTLAKQERVELRGFGAFSTRKRDARTARNPRTGRSIDLGERVTVYYRPGKALKDRVNN